MSSITSSSLSQWAIDRSVSSLQAPFGSFCSQYFETIWTHCSFEMNSQTPSLAITMNLSKLFISSSKNLKFKWGLLWFWYDSYRASYVVSNWSTHCEPGNIFFFEPNSSRSNWLPIGFSEWIYSPVTEHDAFKFIFSIWLMVYWERGSYPIVSLSRGFACYRFNLELPFCMLYRSTICFRSKAT